MLRRNRGKAVINEPSPQKLLPTVKDNKSMTKASEVLKPIILLSLLVGYVPRRFRTRGIFGGVLWLLSLVINCAFSFLSARKCYGLAWASIQILLFISLMMCTFSARRKALPCLEFGLVHLEKESIYLKTFVRIRKLFRIIPWVVIAFSICSAGLVYFCFYYDNAFSVTFEQKVSERWNILFHAIWFITSVHTFYGFALFWCIGMCNMYAVGYSMSEYHEIMTVHLKNKNTPVTFRQAVHSFAERGKYLQKCASACRVPLAFLLVYSIASLAVNAFYFLYKTRRAGYVFFALMPPICSVYPLCLAAWVTRQYKWYLAVVVKAWAERPESTDEESESDSVQPIKDKRKPSARKLTKRAKSARNKKDNEDDMDTNRHRSLFSFRRTRPNPIAGGSFSDTENQVGKGNSEEQHDGSAVRNNRTLSPLRQTRSNPITSRSYSDIQNHDGKIGIENHRSDLLKPAIRSSITSVSDTENVAGDLHDERLPSHQHHKTMDTLDPYARHSISDDEPQTEDEGKPSTNDDDDKNTKSKVSRQRVMELILRGTARAVGRLQHRAKMPKFNFEKYISYLQNVIPTIGFKIMGIIVTWNMVSTLLFLEVSLLALFVQESIFGAQKAKVSL